MTKKIGLIVLGLSIALLSGCGGGGEDYSSSGGSADPYQNEIDEINENLQRDIDEKMSTFWGGDVNYYSFMLQADNSSPSITEIMTNDNYISDGWGLYFDNYLPDSVVAIEGSNDYESKKYSYVIDDNDKLTVTFDDLYYDVTSSYSLYPNNERIVDTSYSPIDELISSGSNIYKATKTSTGEVLANKSGNFTITTDGREKQISILKNEYNDGSGGSDAGSSGSDSGSGSSSEMECAASDYPGWLSDEPQLVGQCQMAWLNECQRDNYPSQREELTNRMRTYCKILDDWKAHSDDGSNPKDKCLSCAEFEF